jgi:hypothetical protein
VPLFFTRSADGRRLITVRTRKNQKKLSIRGNEGTYYFAAATEPDACARSVEDFRHESWAEEGKSIRFEDALQFDTSVGLLCPKIEEPLD